MGPIVLAKSWISVMLFIRFVFFSYNKQQQVELKEGITGCDRQYTIYKEI